MKLLIFILFPYVLTVSTSSLGQQQRESKEVLYVGTYSDRGSQGIYVFQFDRTQGTLTEIQTVGGGRTLIFLKFIPMVNISMPYTVKAYPKNIQMAVSWLIR